MYDDRVACCPPESNLAFWLKFWWGEGRMVDPKGLMEREVGRGYLEK